MDLALIPIAAIGCVTVIVLTVLDKFSGGRGRGLQAELTMLQERLGLQTSRIVELERQNEQLEKQLEWNVKLLDAQDRVMKQLDAGPGAVAASQRVETPALTR